MIKNWKKWVSGIAGTFSMTAMAVWIHAILAVQPMVSPQFLPVVKTGIEQWVFTNDYVTVISNYEFTIKSGFKTDFASIPSVLHKPFGLQNASPSLMRAASCHDLGYSLLMPDGSGPVDQDTLDLLLMTGALEDGTVAAKDEAIWLAVHYYGFAVIGRHTATSVKEAMRFGSIRKLIK